MQGDPGVTDRLPRRAVLLAGGATLLAGCESLTQDAEFRPGFRFEANPAFGAIIGTIESFGPFAFAAGNSFVSMYAADVLEADGRPRPGVELVANTRNRTPLEGRIFQAPTGFGGYDFDTPERSAVRLFAASLPERDYVFTSFTYQFSTLPRIGTTRLPPIRVRPRAGTVTYVGSLGFVPDGQNRLRAIALRDQSARDLPRLRAQFDWLEGRQITVALPEANGWPRQITIPPFP